MAHEIETAFFYKHKAWHGLGNVVQEKPRTTREAMQLADLGWTVSKQPLHVHHADGSVIEVPDQFATVRDSDNSVLGIVGDRYDPLQNHEAFSFFDPFVEDGSMFIDAAGSLRRGKRVFVLARAEGMTGEVVPGDRVNQHLLLWTSHDGTMATGIMWTPIRVVCMNTLRAATKNFEATEAIKIPHTVSQRDSLQLVQDAVDIARRSFDVSLEAFRSMQQRELDLRGLEQFVRMTFDRVEYVDDENNPVSPPLPQAFEKVLESWEFGPGADIDGVKGTVWGAYNAVTDWIDHGRGSKRKGETDAQAHNRRLDQSWFGSGSRLRQKAFDAAMEMVAL